MTETETTLRVWIVAAYASVRAGLHALLAVDGDIDIVTEVGGSADLERLLAGSAPDVVVCDNTEGDGMHVLQTLITCGVGLVLLDDGPDLAATLTDSDLPGYGLLRKDADGPELAGAVRAVAAGLVVLDRRFAPHLSHSVPASLSDAEAVSGEPLTVREREVLQWMAQGLPNKQIAARLGISPHTAKFHVASVLAKLGAASRAEAVTLGARRGDLLL